ncbi:uncharacterized protein LOC143917252 [Arctopsyche grandis]|uniref:uncharacterized protein LOC143917252 n=1 Tax=Arctopsyche grandis TaxID=121162 RepID=UPI00406D8863
MSESNNGLKNPCLCANLTSLAMFGLWPFQSEKFLNSKILRKVHFAFGLFAYCVNWLFLASQYIDLYKIWGNLENMTTNISVTSLTTIGVVKIFTFYGYRNKLDSLITEISRVEVNIIKNQCSGVKSLLYEYVKTARRVTYFFWTLTFCTILVFFIIPPIEYKLSSTYHKTYSNGSEYWTYERPMIFSTWFPFDKYSIPNYYIAYLIHILFGLLGASYHAIWDMFVISMMVHFIGQLRILQRNLAETTNVAELDPELIRNDVKVGHEDKFLTDLNQDKTIDSREVWDVIKHKRLVDCVNHHRYILKYTHDLNSIMRPVMMLYFIVCSIMLCAIGFQASLYGFSIRLCFMLEFLMSMMIQLFLFYWHGNEIICENENLLFSMYCCEWFKESKRFKTSFLIMTDGFKLPIKFTVGSFYDMSLPTFVASGRFKFPIFQTGGQTPRRDPDERYMDERSASKVIGEIRKKCGMRCIKADLNLGYLFAFDNSCAIRMYEMGKLVVFVRFALNFLINNNALMTKLRTIQFTGSMVPKNVRPLYLWAFHIHRMFINLIWLSLIIAFIGDIVSVGDNLILLGEDVCVLISFVFVISKYLVILTNYNELERVAERIMIIGEKNHKEDTAKLYYHIRKKYIIVITGITVLFHVLSVLLLIALIMSAPKGGLPLRAYYPIDLNKKYLFALIFLHQLLGLFYVLNSIVASDSTCATNDFEVQSVAKIRLKELIKRHQYIIQLAKELNAITSPQLSAQLFASNFMICLTGFEATLTINDTIVFLRFLVHLVSALFQLLFWCLHGEIIFSKSIAIANSVFYNLNFITDKSTITNLKIVIARCQKPVFIKAGRINKFNLATFLTVVKGSYSYFALLRTLNDS